MIQSINITNGLSIIENDYKFNFNTRKVDFFVIVLVALIKTKQKRIRIAFPKKLTFPTIKNRTIFLARLKSLLS
jgi:hypothetical protein